MVTNSNILYFKISYLEAEDGRPNVVVPEVFRPEAETGRPDVVLGPEAEAGRPDVVVPEAEAGLPLELQFCRAP